MPFFFATGFFAGAVLLAPLVVALVDDSVEAPLVAGFEVVAVVAPFAGLVFAGAVVAPLVEVVVVVVGAASTIGATVLVGSGIGLLMALEMYASTPSFFSKRTS